MSFEYMIESGSQTKTTNQRCFMLAWGDVIAPNDIDQFEATTIMNIRYGLICIGICTVIAIIILMIELILENI